MQYGLIGKKLSHSYSAEIHKSIGDYRYELLEIAENELADFFKNRDFLGINVTIPYKETVIPLIDEISDNVKKIGAVNTVINKGGRLIGYNTDFDGMKMLISHYGISLFQKKVAILGTGGTSKTAYAVSESLGAKQIVFVSRSEKPNSITFSELYEKYDDVQIIINTTPSGMFPKESETPVLIDNFPHLEGVIDAVYNPLRTNLVLSAQKRGLAAAGGLYMLAAQAVFASALFTDTKPDKGIIDKAFRDVSHQKENIVLIGMPSSGKSTVGKLLSDILKTDFFDSDEEIIKDIKMPISEFFKRYGEAEFRKLEKDIIAVLSRKSGVVIATGGGAVLDNENALALKRNGRMVFLNRPLEMLMPTCDRPLSSDYEALKQMFSVRYPIYKEAADTEILANSTPLNAAHEILKELKR